MASSPSWYDVLGVRRDASHDEIKQAWRRATDSFEPGQSTGQFELFNRAAATLLDPAKRADYDQELSREDQAQFGSTSAPHSAGVSDSQSPASDPNSAGAEKVDGKRTKAKRSGSARGFQVSVWVLALLALLTALAVALGVTYTVKHDNYTATQSAGVEASTAVAQSLPVVLSYDYRHLEQNRQAAMRFLTPAYQKQYGPTFNLIQGTRANPGGAIQTKAVVTASVQSTGVEAATSNVAQIVAFVNQATVKDGGRPDFSLDRVVVTMVKKGNQWLIDNISSY